MNKFQKAMASLALVAILATSLAACGGGYGGGGGNTMYHTPPTPAPTKTR